MTMMLVLVLRLVPEDKVPFLKVEELKDDRIAVSIDMENDMIRCFCSDCFDGTATDGRC